MKGFVRKLIDCKDYCSIVSEAKWLSSEKFWLKYRRQIVVTEQSGSNLTDYQILIELNSSNFDFSHVNNDGSDIRFSDAFPYWVGNLYPYWIEKWDSVNQEAKIWVKVPSIPANSSVSFYMYYGNPNVTSVSDGDATFEFFDDFDTVPTDLEKVNATVEAVNIDGVSALHIYYASHEAKVKFTRKSFRARDGNLILYSKVKTDSNAHDVELGWIKVGGTLSDNTRGPWNVSNPGGDGNTRFWHRYEDGVHENYMDYSQSANTWYFHEFYINGNNLKSRYWKTTESKPASWTFETTYSLSATDYYVLLGTYHEDWFDYVLVRKYTDPEPSVSIGSEETP